MFFNLFGKKKKSLKTMTNDEVFAKIKPIIVKEWGLAPSDVTPDASFIYDLGADEWDLNDLWKAVAQEFDVKLPAMTGAELQRTIRSVEEFILLIKSEKGQIQPLRHRIASREVRLTVGEILGVSRLEIHSASHLIRDLGADELDFSEIMIALVDQKRLYLPQTLTYLPNASSADSFVVADGSKRIPIRTVGDLVSLVDQYSDC